MVTTIEIEKKYNVGDNVSYVDIGGKERTGTVIEVGQTDVYPWNKDKEVKALYRMNNYDYLRYEEEILGYTE